MDSATEVSLHGSWKITLQNLGKLSARCLCYSFSNNVAGLQVTALLKMIDKNSELPSYNFTENDVENDVVDKNS